MKNQRSTQNKPSGFTLLEILVVMSIMGVLLGTGLMSFDKSSRQKKLDKDVEFVSDVLSLARQKSISRDIGLTSCAVFAGYVLSFTASSNVFTLSIDCGSLQSVQSYTLQDSVISKVIPAGIVRFDYPYGAVAAAKNIEVKSKQTKQCKSITIDTAGIVTVGNSYSC